jgi:hypothetical protein
VPRLIKSNSQPPAISSVFITENPIFAYSSLLETIAQLRAVSVTVVTAVHVSPGCFQVPQHSEAHLCATAKLVIAVLERLHGAPPQKLALHKRVMASRRSPTSDSRAEPIPRHCLERSTQKCDISAIPYQLPYTIGFRRLTLPKYTRVGVVTFASEPRGALSLTPMQPHSAPSRVATSSADPLAAA